MTPFTIESNLNKTKKGDTEDTFSRVNCLNVNLFHDLWKGFEFEFLHIQNDNPSTALYLFQILVAGDRKHEWNNLFHSDFNRPLSYFVWNTYTNYFKCDSMKSQNTHLKHTRTCHNYRINNFLRYNICIYNTLHIYSIPWYLVNI